METDVATRDERTAAAMAARGLAAVAAAPMTVAVAWTTVGRATVKRDATWDAEWKPRR